MAGFENLRIWQKAHELMEKIHALTKQFPYNELYKIKDQLDRSSMSIGANIAEGYASYYYKDKIKSFYVSRKEAAETQNHIRVIQSFNLISKKTADELILEYEGLIKGINAYINYVSSKRNRKTNLFSR